MKKQPLEQPLNSNERFLHAVAVRLDVLIEQVTSIVEHIAKQDEVAVTESKVEEEEVIAPAPVARKRTVKK